MSVRLPMLIPCNHLRRDECGHYGCAVLGECKPIHNGPDLSGCPEFSPNGVTRKQVMPSDDDFTEYCPCRSTSR